MKPQIFNFSAPWCKYCNDLAPVWDEVAEKFKDQLDFRHINVDETPDIQKAFTVENLPTIIIMKAGKEVRRYYGFPQPLEERIIKFLDNSDS